MVRALVVLVALTGCDALFGLDHVDEPTRVVEGKWVRRYLANNANHAPVVLDDAYRTDEVTSIEVHADDGTVLAHDWNYATGEVTFTSVGPYRVTLTFTNGTSEELQLDTPTFDHPAPFYVRRDAVNGDATTRLAGTINPSGDETVLQTTGVWTQTVLPGTVGDFDVPWALPLIDQAKFDRLHAVRFSTVNVVSVITAFAARDITMTNGPNTGITLDLADITAPWCARITSEATTEIARLASRYDDLDEMDFYGWNLYATPSNDLPPGFALLLASPRVVQETTAFNYSTPYAGFGTRLNLGAQRQVTITSPVAIRRFAGTTSFLAIHDSVSCESYTAAAGTVALPDDFVLGGTPLASDGQEIDAGTDPIELTWSVDGPADLFRVHLYDVTDGSRRSVRVFYTVEPRATIDPALLVAGRVYMFQTNAIAGSPNAATGDFRTITTTYAQSYYAAPVFIAR